MVDQEDAATKAVNEHLDAIGSVRTRRQLYPTFMSDFVQSVPPGSSIRVKNLNTTGGATAAAPAKGKGAPASQAPGSIKFDLVAEAEDYNDIALWIKSLESYGRDMDSDVAPAAAAPAAPAAAPAAPAPAAEPAPSMSAWDRFTAFVLGMTGHAPLPPHQDVMPQRVARAPSAPTAGSGPLVDDPQAEAESMAVVKSLAKSSGGSYPWRIVTVGPALWKRLQSRDASLAESGESAQLGKPGQPAFEGRSFSPGRGDGALYHSPVLQQWAKMFTVGQARPARQPERDFFYAMTPFEIKDQPVTIIEAAGERLLVYADKQNQNLWLEFAPVVHHEGTFSGVDMGAVTRVDGAAGAVYSFTLTAAYAAGKSWQN